MNARRLNFLVVLACCLWTSAHAQRMYDSSGSAIGRIDGERIYSASGQNVGRVDTQGVETAFAGYDIGWIGLDLSASLTYAESIIQENDGFVSVPGDTARFCSPTALVCLPHAMQRTVFCTSSPSVNACACR